MKNSSRGWLGGYNKQPEWGRVWKVGDRFECCDGAYGDNEHALTCDCRCHYVAQQVRRRI